MSEGWKTMNENEFLLDVLIVFCFEEKRVAIGQTNTYNIENNSWIFLQLITCFS